MIKTDGTFTSLQSGRTIRTHRHRAGRGAVKGNLALVLAFAVLLALIVLALLKMSADPTWP